MNGFVTMIKMNLKLLLRNKGYLAFLFILPILSVIMLNVDNVNTMNAVENAYVIKELSNDNEEILTVSNSKMNIMVYDSSNSVLSDYVLQELAKTGSYHIYRYKEKGIDLSKAREKALDTANHNVIGAVIYIPDTFEKEILKGNDSNMVVFEATGDGRIELLKNNIAVYLQSVYLYAEETGYDKAALTKLLTLSAGSEASKEIVSIEVGDTLNLSAKQQSDSSSIGYSISFLTISFLFSGVFIAATVVDERQYRVYNRFVLSNASMGSYGLVKIIMVLLTVLMQTGIIAVGIKLLVKADFGIPFISYLFLIFCLGMILNLFSVVIGVLTNNVLTSNYIVFLVWCLSCLIAGLYFPLDGASKWWARASMLMPQRWVVKASEMIMAEKSGVYAMFILVVLSFLLVITSVGLMGIKMRRRE